MKVTKQPEYQIWSQMKQRCYNKNHKKYRIYGKRGITICERWKDSYANFIQDMGPRPSDRHSIDRIDNDGIYEPSNCRWALREQQDYNKSNNFNVAVGDRFGKLTHTGNRRHRPMNDTPNHKRWELEFTCDCGATKWYRLDKLKQIGSPSCGSPSCKQGRISGEEPKRKHYNLINFTYPKLNKTNQTNWYVGFTQNNRQYKIKMGLNRIKDLKQREHTAKTLISQITAILLDAQVKKDKRDFNDIIKTKPLSKEA